MDYRVALDTADGAMANTWMKAAGQNGIPASFIINKEGKVAWIGHPMQMDKPLADIVAGKWDLQAAASEFKNRAANQKKLAALRTKLAQAQKSDNKEDLVKVIDEAITDDPTLEKSLAQTKFAALQRAGLTDKAVSYGQMLVEKTYKDDSQQLNVLAWNLVDPAKKEKLDGKLLKLALQAAQRADEVAERKDFMIADTLAVAYFANGDAQKAVETEERAVKLAGSNAGEEVAEMKARLEQFRKAAEKK